MSTAMNASGSYDRPTAHDLCGLMDSLSTEEKQQLLTLAGLLIEARETGTYEAAYLYAHAVLLQARERRGDTPDEAMAIVAESMRGWANLPGVPGKEAVS